MTVKTEVEYKVNSGNMRQALTNAYWSNEEIDYLMSRLRKAGF